MTSSSHVDPTGLMPGRSIRSTARLNLESILSSCIALVADGIRASMQPQVDLVGSHHGNNKDAADRNVSGAFDSWPVRVEGSDNTVIMR